MESDIDAPMMQKSLDDLEWPKLVRAIVGRCAGPRARREELPIAPTVEETRTALRETEEAMRLLERGEPLPVEGIPDVVGALDRLARHGAIEGPALRDVRVALEKARVLRRFLGRNKASVPTLLARCSTNPTLDDLEEELGSALEPDGTLSDRASPDLRRLRTEVANLRARVVARLDELIQRHADILSDRFHTIREGRFVLPIRRDAHEHFPGIVHGTSASGATVFVEPRALVVHGNRLKMAQAELTHEETRILAILSDHVRDRLDDVQAAVEALDHADLRSACARFGRDVKATIVTLVDEPILRFEEARHPLLALENGVVVPNDIELRAGQALILSGPNAGGKTVALKLLGLGALMVRAGLPLCVREGGQCGFFDPILTDVGDQQSIAANLSTFSAHVTNLARVLVLAGGRSLVLLDELAGGTDPQEGAALACAVVDALCRRGAAIAVTTHYEPLKALAFRDARLRNAAVGFDIAQMRPTFELTMDVPGASSALAVAAQFGIPQDIIDTAREVLPEQSRTFDDLVQRLEDERRALAIARAGAEEELRRTQALRDEAEQQLQRVRTRERGALTAEATKLREAIQRARDEVREARKRLRSAEPSEETLGNARATLDEAARAVVDAETLMQAPARGASAERTPAAVSDLEVGVRVWVPRLRAEAEVIEKPTRGRVRVAAGPMKLWVDVPGLALVAPQPTGTDAAPRPREPDVSPVNAIRTSENTLDVRGLRVDDALSMTQSFLDRLYGSSEPVAYILHGVGSGALRDAIREHVRRDHSYVKSSRSATNDEGGDRYTVVYLS